MLDKKEFQQRLQKVESLVRTIESAADPNVRAGAVELMQTLMEMNGAGLERMMEIVFESGSGGAQVINRFADDELVGSLLLLYDLHPVSSEARVMQALEKVRPYLQSHGGNVEFIGIDDEGVLRLRLEGSCHGCGSSQMTLKLAIEEAINENAPDISALVVEGIVEETKPPALVQLGRTAGDNSNGAKTNGDNGWKDVGSLISLSDGGAKMMEVSDRQILFCRLGDTFYAYGDICPDCGGTMQAATLEAQALICPACLQRFDVIQAGRSFDKPELQLQPFPLLIEQGRAKIALPH